eukprot:COSAG01_NODE_1484_length_10156_cov_258.444864_2_plen_161_part_00
MAACGASVSNASVSPSHQRALMTRVASCRAGGEHSQRPHRSAAQTVSRRERSRRQQRRGAAVGAQDHAAIVECKMIDRRQTADRASSAGSMQRQANKIIIIIIVPVASSSATGIQSNWISWPNFHNKHPWCGESQFLIYHTKGEAHVRMVRGVIAARPLP